MLLILMRKLPIKACSDPFRFRDMLKKENKLSIKSVSDICEPFTRWVSFQVPIKVKNTRIGKNVRVRIIVNLLLICASKNALSNVKKKLTISDTSVFGTTNFCKWLTISVV